MDLLIFDIKNYVITVLIGLITYFLLKFYVKVASYPSGPFPWPVIGNILSKFN
jgi:hypothetical protein